MNAQRPSGSPAAALGCLGALALLLAIRPICYAAGPGSYLISTLAGGAMPATPIAGTSASVPLGYGVALDSSGNVYFPSPNLNAVFKLDTSGILTRVAGTGQQGFSGDKGPALGAQLNGPYGVAVDSTGNVYVADTGNNRIRKIDTSGTITTVAGNGVWGTTGDNGPATAAEFRTPNGVAVDAAGLLYIADTQNNRIRKVDANGTITTVAGSGWMGYQGDGVAATSTGLAFPYAVAVDAAGNLYIADTNDSRIRKVDTKGTIITVAGTSINGYLGDGGPATGARLWAPAGVALDSAGNIYIADADNGRIRKVDTSGTIATVAGTGTLGNAGDGGAATSAQLFNPAGVAVDGAGALYIMDGANNQLRKVSAGGTIATLVGSAAGDGGPGAFALLDSPYRSARDGAGNVYVSDNGHHRVRRIAPNGVITTVAGTGVSGYSGDNGAAVNAQLNLPGAVAVDAAGNLYIGDTNNNVVRKVSASGIITTAAGNGTAGSTGDGGPAVAAELRVPLGLAVDPAGNLYIADTHNSRIRKVDTNGTITTVAGTGVSGYSGDGQAATGAKLSFPYSVAADAGGNLYIADSSNYRIRKVDTSGNISTVAGFGTYGESGDGGVAVGAQFEWPYDVAVDAAGSLYIADGPAGRIRAVSTAGIITTIAGNGTADYSGDGGPGVSAAFNTPTGISVDPSGVIYVADMDNSAIRVLTPVGTRAVLTIQSSHSGSFAQSQTGATYSLTVANAATAGATSGAVTVTEMVPAGLTLVSMAGSGWNCSGTACTRSDMLAGGSSYPAITVTVNVAAAAPTQVTNRATVSGGGGFGAGASDFTITAGTAAPPQITLVSNDASGQTAIAPNTWVSIYGSNFAPAGFSGDWSQSIVNGLLPTTLDGVSVSIGGNLAYVEYVSPTQINVLAPSVVAPGSALVTVTTAAGTAPAATVTAQQFSPAFFVWPNGQPAATHADYSLAVKNGTFAGATTVPAKPGEAIILWGTGFGPTSPAAPAGAEVPASAGYNTANPATVTIGGVSAAVYGTALASGFAGLYQVVVTVPATLADGDYALVATVGGVPSATTTLTVQH